MSLEYIRLQEASCHNCMRCVRSCPIDAMTYVKNQPKLIQEDCILCGKCYVVCPHEAKMVYSDLAKVKTWLQNHECVILSVAPSFTAVWPNFESLKKVLLKYGFYDVLETSQGAALVSKAYANLMAEHQMKNIITTCCPSVNTYIEKYYGELATYLAPVVSPMIAHAKMIKEQYPDSKVVFLTPCIAKIKEAQDERFAGYVDACLSMEEVHTWIYEKMIPEEVEKWQDFEGSIARLYPCPSGILSTIEPNKDYKFVSVDGIENVKQVLDALKNHQLEGYFFEMNACQGSCLAGPLLAKFKHNQWLGQSVIRENVNHQSYIKNGILPLDLSAKYENRQIMRPSYTEEQIQETLLSMGKNSPLKMHDCGACGYETCRLKAIAVLDGKADPRICLPEVLSKAQSISNAIIENTPNGIVIVDENLCIKQVNPSAMKMLNIDYECENLPLGMILPDEALCRLVQLTGYQPEYIRIQYPQYDKLIDHAIVKLRQEPYTVLILMDRTLEAHKEEILKQMREETIQVTQQVIDEQMRTVQEIASLLGETTAKSKVALTHLKQMMDEVDDA